MSCVCSSCIFTQNCISDSNRTVCIVKDIQTAEMAWKSFISSV